MNFESAEVARKIEMLLRGDVLIAEEEKLPLQQRTPQLRQRCAVERLAEVDAIHLRANRGRQRRMQASRLHYRRSPDMDASSVCLTAMARVLLQDSPMHPSLS